MASGTPVAISDAAALLEVAGEAALVAAADDPRTWVSAMETIATDETRRAELRVRGLARAAHFSWERAARETAEVYTRVLAEPRHGYRERSSRAS